MAERAGGGSRKMAKAEGGSKKMAEGGGGSRKMAEGGGGSKKMAEEAGGSSRKMAKGESGRRFEQALQFAMQAHQGQVRKGTEIPYIVHPIETALIAMTLTNDQDTAIAALLHDVIEDTPYGAGEIAELFGQHVAQLVQAESEDKRKGQDPSDTWKIRKQEFVDSLCRKTKEEKIIALADKLSNIRATYYGCREDGEAFWQRFHEKRKEMHAWYYHSIVARLKEFEDTDAWKELDRLVRAVFGEDPMG